MAFRVLNVQVKVDLYMVCRRSQLHYLCLSSDLFPEVCQIFQDDSTQRASFENALFIYSLLSISIGVTVVIVLSIAILL